MLDRSLSARCLTSEQQSVVQLARPPPPRGTSRIAVTIAGPGSGKTTTQEDLIEQLVNKGNTVLKIFFNKGATEDAKARLEQRLGHKAERVWCITSHKAAKDFARPVMTPGGPAVHTRCVSDNEMQARVARLFENEIAAFTGWVGPQAPRTPEEHKTCKREAKLVTMWIFKTFLQWLGSKKTAADLQQPANGCDYDTYYPARLGHDKGKLSRCRRGPGNFYKVPLRRLSGPRRPPSPTARPARRPAGARVRAVAAHGGRR